MSSYVNLYSSEPEAVLDIMDRFGVSSSANSWEVDEDRHPPLTLCFNGIYHNSLKAKEEVKFLRSLFESLGLEVKVGYTSTMEPTGKVDGRESKVRVINMYIR